MRYTGCGNPDQLLWVARDRELVRLASNTIPVGLLEPERFRPPPEGLVRVGPGGKLLLFTDGLLDLQRSEGSEIGQLGLADELREILEQPADEAAPRVFDRLGALQNRECDLDLLLVCVELKHPGCVVSHLGQGSGGSA